MPHRISTRRRQAAPTSRVSPALLGSSSSNRHSALQRSCWSACKRTTSRSRSRCRLDLGRDLKRGSAPEVSVWIDGAMPSRAETILGYVGGVHAHALKDIARPQPGATLATPAAIVLRYRYYPSFESVYAIVPSVPAILLIMFPAVLAAISVAREKEPRVHYQFLRHTDHTTRISARQAALYIAIGMLNYLILTVMGVVVFQVPLKGSGLALTSGRFSMSRLPQVSVSSCRRLRRAR